MAQTLMLDDVGNFISRILFEDRNIAPSYISEGFLFTTPSARSRIQAQHGQIGRKVPKSTISSDVVAVFLYYEHDTTMPYPTMACSVLPTPLGDPD